MARVQEPDQYLVGTLVGGLPTCVFAPKPYSRVITNIVVGNSVACNVKVYRQVIGSTPIAQNLVGNDNTLSGELMMPAGQTLIVQWSVLGPSASDAFARVSWQREEDPKELTAVSGDVSWSTSVVVTLTVLGPGGLLHLIDSELLMTRSLMSYVMTALTDIIFRSKLAADTAQRFTIRADGDMLWGDGTDPADVTLFRRNPNQLGIDDASILPIRDVVTNTAFGTKATADSNFRYLVSAEGRIVWGDGTAAVDTVLYREAANILGTDDQIRATRTGSGDDCFTARVSGDTVDRINIEASGDIRFSDGTTQQMILDNLDVDDLQLIDGRFRVRRGASTDAAFGAYVSGDSQTRYNVRTDGRITWSDGSAGADTNLYRGGASLLQTDDTFTAADLQIGGVSLLDLVYPVGSYYISSVNTSPASFLGGTWTQRQDRVLIGAGGTYTVGTTGGSVNTSAGGDHSHGGATGFPNSLNEASSPGAVVPDEFHTHTISASGTHTHNNSLPPWRAAYMWERTA